MSDSMSGPPPLPRLGRPALAPPPLPPDAEGAGDAPPVLRPYRAAEGRGGDAGARRAASKDVKKLLVPLGVIGAILFKFKGLLLAALKFLPVLLKTGGSMFVSIGLYAMYYGWWFAVGFVVLLFVHECGHLIAARRLGLNVGAPVFIPFLGAFIALKEAPKNAWIEAQVGIGGPLLGTLGAVVCYAVYLATGERLFAALAFFGFFLNLFNLAPVGWLDGGRVATALSPWLWIVGLVVIGVMLARDVLGGGHFNIILLLVFLTALPRVASLFRPRTVEEQRYFEVTPMQRWGMGAVYFGLVVFLVLAMGLSQIDPRR